MSDKIPTESLSVLDADNWEAEATAFAEKLIADGKRPWFEVRWPAPEHLTPIEQEQWLARQEDTFDALEYNPTTGMFTTLPPYAELEA